MNVKRCVADEVVCCSFRFPHILALSLCYRPLHTKATHQETDTCVPSVMSCVVFMDDND